MSNLPPSALKQLELRLENLEEQTRFTLDILELAATLGDFQTSVNKLHTPTEILEETIPRVHRIIPFLATAFYLVDESDSDFELTLARPEKDIAYIEKEVARLIDNGIFALALRENRPVTVYAQDKDSRFILHALATSSRTRGMFVGLLPRRDRNVSAVLLSLLTLILKNCANAIESFELYRLFHERRR